MRPSGQPSHRARFTAAAASYDRAATVQDRVARRVLDLVPEDASPARVLDAGCGTGCLLALARGRWPTAHLTGVDLSTGMLAAARRHLSHDPALTLVEADLSHHAHPAGYDLILSASSLHWLDPFKAGLTSVIRLIRPGGLLAAGIMLDGTLAELHAARREAAPGKPPMGRLPSFDDLSGILRALPAMRIHRLEHTTEQTASPSARDLLRTVHDLGVTGGAVSRSTAALTRTELDRLVRIYDNRFASPDGVRVTYEVGYLLLEAHPRG